MYMISDRPEQDVIEAAIREAHKQRALAIAQGLKAFATWVKKEFTVLRSFMKNRKSATNFTHTGHVA